MLFPNFQAKTKGFNTKYDLGVKYAEKQHRKFAPDLMREGRNVIGLQVCNCLLFSQLLEMNRDLVSLDLVN